MPTMNLKETLKKQGGIKLLRQYWKCGAFFTAVCEFVLLGKSRTALEILRLSAGLKTKQKLEKKYKKCLLLFDEDWKAQDGDHSLKHISSNKVWICWFQGMEQAPALVKRCYQSVKENMPDREIVLITSENMMDYVQFPDYIQNKIERGIIKGAHLSDLLRLELLTRYGGTWIDATVYCTGSDIPKYMLDSKLFVFQNLKPGRDGHCTVISNWFITAYSNNKILLAVQNLLYSYWNRNDELIDYFIFHVFFQIVIEKYYEEWSDVVPFSNSTPHILLLRLFEKYDKDVWDAVKEQCCFQKLTYKFSDEDANKNDTYYSKIIEMETLEE
jgi:hypothetical protein